MYLLIAQPASAARSLVQPAAAAHPQATAPARLPRRERDFGVGYGSSSGYAARRRYVNDWGLGSFRCV